MNDLIFYSIASGSSGNCYFFGNRQYGFLIDAGINAKLILKHLRSVDIDIPQVRALFVTHIHKDHTQAMSVVGNRWNVPVYSTKKTFLEIERADYIRRKVNRTNCYFLEHGERMQLGDFFITSFFVPHDVEDNSGFIIEYKGICVVLATDIGHVTQGLIDVVRQADYLIIESNHDREMLRNGRYPLALKQRIIGNDGHLSNDETAELVANHAKDGLKGLFLCHLSEENNSPVLAVETMRKMIEEVKGVDSRWISLPIIALERKVPQVYLLK